MLPRRRRPEPGGTENPSYLLEDDGDEISCLLWPPFGFHRVFDVGLCRRAAAPLCRGRRSLRTVLEGPKGTAPVRHGARLSGGNAQEPLAHRSAKAGAAV